MHYKETDPVHTIKVDQMVANSIFADSYGQEQSLTMVIVYSGTRVVAIPARVYVPKVLGTVRYRIDAETAVSIWVAT